MNDSVLVKVLQSEKNFSAVKSCGRFVKKSINVKE
jgi:hypothetical protein